jgi:hypothetical protein
VCILYFDENGAVESHLGDPLRYFSGMPGHIDDVQRELSASECGNAAEIRAFFAEGRAGKNPAVSLSMRPNSEIYLALSHQGRVLFLEENSSHYVRNQQIRQMQALGARGPSRSEHIPEAAVIIFQGLERDHRDAVIECAREVELRDRRYNKLVFVRKITNAEDDRGTILSFLLRSMDSLGNGKCAAVIGGPLSIFGPVAGVPVLRNRLFGSVYELATQMIAVTDQGHMLVQKELFQATQSAYLARETHHYTFPDGTVQVISLP